MIDLQSKALKSQTFPVILKKTVQIVIIIIEIRVFIDEIFIMIIHQDARNQELIHLTFSHHQQDHLV